MEFWDVYDSCGRVTGRFKERGSVFNQGEYHLCTSLWIVDPGGEKVLLQLRSLDKEWSPGLWGITGGAASAGEDSITACIREVSEEIGLHLRPDEITLLSRTFLGDTLFDDYVIILDFNIADAVLQDGEVTELRWFTFEEVMDLHYSGQLSFGNITAEIDKLKSHFKAVLGG